jgi:hypothetical protein
VSPRGSTTSPRSLCPDSGLDIIGVQLVVAKLDTERIVPAFAGLGFEQKTTPWNLLDHVPAGGSEAPESRALFGNCADTSVPQARQCSWNLRENSNGRSTTTLCQVCDRRRRQQAGLTHKRETSSVTISAAGRGCLASATLCPAHMESPSMSPVVPTIGGAGS